MKFLPLLAFSAFPIGSTLHLQHRQKTRKSEKWVDVESLPPRSVIDAGCTKKAVDQLNDLHREFSVDGGKDDDILTFNFGVKFLHACQRTDMFFHDIVSKGGPLFNEMETIFIDCVRFEKPYTNDGDSVLGINLDYSVEDFKITSFGSMSPPGDECLKAIRHMNGKHNRDVVAELIQNFDSVCHSITDEPEKNDPFEIKYSPAQTPGDHIHYPPEEEPEECTDPPKYPKVEGGKSKNPYNVVVPKDRCCAVCDLDSETYACGDKCVSIDGDCEWRVEWMLENDKKKMLQVNNPGCACDDLFTCTRPAPPPPPPEEGEEKPDKPKDDDDKKPTEDEESEKPIKPHDGSDTPTDPTEPTKPEETDKDKDKKEEEGKTEEEGTSTPEKNDKKDEKKKSGFCFPSSALFTLQDGTQRRADSLQIGDRVLVVSENQKPVFEPIVFFAVNRPEAVYDMKRLTMSTGQVLSLTGTHFVNVRKGNVGSETLTRSENVEVGDGMWVVNAQGVRLPATVTKTETVTLEGLFAPVPLSASRLVVDNVEASAWGAFFSFGLFGETAAPAVYSFLRTVLLRPLFALANVLEGPDLMARGAMAIWGDGSGVMSVDAALSSFTFQLCVQVFVLFASLLCFCVGIGKKKQAA
uniref:Hint domain-containing protein n=1 Tax=Chromera velia CCMP2878 TaxID=1169474 RepID=A0A0G4IB02_9ALVE|eukprot:Cvel_12730.t1-p1 / transcript=Cvel_12730.t1 / gene=Cvel_12730 / organism=Chromera_velia_CCMP2878 / gene_product=Protein hedgehog, putative / transcript_product=Protein hedgehog, putative / location=Cvel_scaffold845:42009-44334(-) / protein_length=635 / sequence_SO=supercontig / SO=protein_coding / is_pseudo=false